MAESFNERVQDAMISAQIRALRQGATVAAALRERFAALEKVLLALLASHDPASPVRLRTRQSRVEDVLKEAQPLIREAYGAMSRDSARQITANVLNGLEALSETINAAAGGIPLLTQTVTTETIAIALSTTPFPSVPSPAMSSTTAPEWWRRQMAKMGQRVEDTLMNGVRQQDTLSQLVTRLRGTARQGFTDGVMAIVKRDAEGLALTAHSMASGQGRDALWSENSSVVKGVVHLSVLDNRVSLICQARSGLRYSLPTHEPVGHKIPYLSGIPYHWRCRSLFQPIFPTFSELLGAKGQRFDDALRRLESTNPGTRASMDGKIPSATTFHEWLSRQSAQTQLRLLGKTRRELWMNGNIELSQLLNQVTGRPLRIEELV